jgi:predicted Zn finger-like uncharacterized protein
MMCTCPKCRQTIELILPDVTEEGKSASCPACNASFVVFKESFGARAMRRTGEISCSSCGNELAPQLHCPACGRPYPDYLVAALGRKKAGTKGPRLKMKTSPFQKKESITSQLPSLDSAMAQEPAAAKKPAAAPQRFSKGVVLATSALVLMALIAAGAGMYFKMKAEAKYMANFALATYGIQVGIDTSREVCQKMATDWKEGVAAGKEVAPRATIAEEKKLVHIQAEIASVKSSLSQEPEKFKTCNAKLARFEGLFGKMHSLSRTPGSSLPAFLNDIDKLDAEYKQTAQQFKAELPPELMKELKSASERYRGLKPLLK